MNLVSLISIYSVCVLCITAGRVDYAGLLRDREDNATDVAATAKTSAEVKIQGHVQKTTSGEQVEYGNIGQGIHAHGSPKMEMEFEFESLLFSKKAREDERKTIYWLAPESESFEAIITQLRPYAETCLENLPRREKDKSKCHEVEVSSFEKPFACDELGRAPDKMGYHFNLGPLHDSLTSALNSGTPHTTKLAKAHLEYFSLSTQSRYDGKVWTKSLGLHEKLGDAYFRGNHVKDDRVQIGLVVLKGNLEFKGVDLGTKFITLFADTVQLQDVKEDPTTEICGLAFDTVF